MDELSKRGATDKRALLEILFGRARLSDDVAMAVQAAVGIAEQTPELAEEVATAIHESCWKQLDAGNAVDIAKSNLEPFKNLAKKIVADPDVQADVREAVKLINEGEQ